MNGRLLLLEAGYAQPPRRLRRCRYQSAPYSGSSHRDNAVGLCGAKPLTTPL